MIVVAKGKVRNTGSAPQKGPELPPPCFRASFAGHASGPLTILPAGPDDAWSPSVARPKERRRVPSRVLPERPPPLTGLRLGAVVLRKARRAPVTRAAALPPEPPRARPTAVIARTAACATSPCAKLPTRPVPTPRPSGGPDLGRSSATQPAVAPADRRLERRSTSESATASPGSTRRPPNPSIRRAARAEPAIRLPTRPAEATRFPGPMTAGPPATVRARRQPLPPKVRP